MVIVKSAFFVLPNSSSVTSSAGPLSSSTPSVSTSAPAVQPQQTPPGRKAVAEAVQYDGNKCPECLVQFSSKEEVATHFQELNPAFSSVSSLY